TDEFKCKLTPLEEVARASLHNSWAGRGLERWVESVSHVCRDLKIDAVVQFLHTGCVTTGGIAKVMEEVLEKELGIPVRNIQGRQNDWSAEDEQEFQGNVNEFIDLCIANKK
ncbi:2-hydroxyacyl-CoA dehydratase family protein, partial [Chloroflexota bacterium]